jgi:hypothetical protein
LAVVLVAVAAAVAYVVTAAALGDGEYVVSVNARSVAALDAADGM